MTWVIDLGHAILLVMIAVAGFFSITFRDLLAAAISLAAMSLLLSLEFYLLQAPDVAIAEAAIGAGLTVAIFVIAIGKTYRMEGQE